MAKYVVLRSFNDAADNWMARFKGYDVDPAIGQHGGFVLDPERETMVVRDGRGKPLKDHATGNEKRRPCTEDELRDRANYYASCRLNWQSVVIDDPTKPVFINPLAALGGKETETFATAEEAKAALAKSAGAAEQVETPAPPSKSDGRKYYAWMQARAREINANLGPLDEKISLNAPKPVLEEYMKSYGFLE